MHQLLDMQQKMQQKYTITAIAKTENLHPQNHPKNGIKNVKLYTFYRESLGTAFHAIIYLQLLMVNQMLVVISTVTSEVLS